jgi:hypoxia up-regulated 1
LEEAKLSAEDIEQVEILGGGIRVPRVQAILKEAMDDKELNVHLNGDEAMSFGSAFIASNSSAAFKVRKVYLTQHPQYDIRVKMTPYDPTVADLKKQAALDSGEAEDDRIVYEKETVLYKRSDYLGQKKTIHLAYDVAMKIEATALHPDGTEEELMVFGLTDIDNIMDKDVMKKETTTRPKVSLSFELSRSHLFRLISAKVNAVETKMEEVVKDDKADKKKGKKDEKEDKEEGEEKKETDDTADEVSDSAKEATDAEDDPVKFKSDSDSESDAGAEKGEDEGEADADAEPEAEKEYKEVTVPHTFTVENITESILGARLLDDDMLKAARKRITVLDKRDKDKQMADDAKNTYEGQIYSLRDWLRDEDNFKYAGEEEREALLKKLDDGEEWLYEDGA